MGSLNKWAVFAGVMLASAACKEDQVTPPLPPVNELAVTVQPVYGGETLWLDSTYVTSEGYKVRFTDLKFYLENIRSGSNLLKDVALFDYRERGIHLLRVIGNAVDFPTLDANIGVDASINHNDPVGFDPASALYISNANDMHWDWNPGYIFFKVEAKVDTLDNGIEEFNHNVVFHIGLDENLKTLSISNMQWQDQGDVQILPLKLDLLAFLGSGPDAIDLKDEYTSHSAPGQEVLTAKAASNFQSALSSY